MKFKLYNLNVLVLLLMFSFEIQAGCLDGITTTTAVVSKVKGIHAAKNNAVHYVILDKATCTAPTSGDVTIGSATKASYYLYIDTTDKSLMATLLSAQARNEDVYFRLWHPLHSNYNQLVYVISPASAVTQ